jgi:hypothetical protein
VRTGGVQILRSSSGALVRVGRWEEKEGDLAGVAKMGALVPPLGAFIRRRSACIVMFVARDTSGLTFMIDGG